MEILDLKQGTPEWHQKRLESFTASEAPVMMNASKYQKRDELLEMKKTGYIREVTTAQQRIFDKGHKAEELARPYAEELTEKTFYPVTGFLEVEGLPLLASYDGLPMLEELVWEHKLYNQALEATLRNEEELDPHYYWQLEQQLLVADAEKAMFMISDFTDLENPKEPLYCYYESKPERREALIAGWHQFEKDLADYEPKQKQTTEAVEKVLPTLPALAIEISGEVQSSNLIAYNDSAVSIIESIPENLVSDQDFVDAKQVVKFCDSVEKEIKQVKKQALSQTASIEELFTKLDALSEAARKKRLALDKKIKTETENRKSNLVAEYRNKWTEHVEYCEEKLMYVNFPKFQLPAIPVDFNGALKNKRTLDSMENALNSELARAKIEADKLTEIIEVNLSKFTKEASDHMALFPDLNQLVNKDPEAFEGIIKVRIMEFKEAEAEKQRLKESEQAEAKAAARELTEVTQEKIDHGQAPALHEQSGFQPESENPAPQESEAFIAPALAHDIDQLDKISIHFQSLIPRLTATKSHVETKIACDCIAEVINKIDSIRLTIANASIEIKNGE